MLRSQYRIREVVIFSRIVAAAILFLFIVAPAVIVLAGSLIPGTPVAVGPIDTGGTSVAALDSSHIAISFEDQDNSVISLTICTVSDTTPTCGSTAFVNFSDYGSPTVITALDSTHVAISYQNQNNVNHPTVVVCSVSGTTPTCGTSVSVASGTGQYVSVAAIDSSHIAITYSDGTNSSHPTVVICSVSGTTPTCGTPVSIASVSSADTSVTALDSSHVAIGYEDINNNTFATIAVCSVSGTTPTCGTPVSGFFGDPAGLTSVAALDSSHVAIGFYDAGAGGVYAEVCSVSGTTPTCSGSDWTTVDVQGSNSVGIAALDSSHFAVAHTDAPITL